MKREADFTRATKKLLAERVNYICSNPVCNAPTIGPHSDPKKKISVGEAAHICAAESGVIGGQTRRYNLSQSPEQRKSIENGIWLCCICANLIDSDEKLYDVDILHGWKAQAEAKARANIGRTASNSFSSLFFEESFAPTINAPNNSGTIQIAKVINNGFYPKITKKYNSNDSIFDNIKKNVYRLNGPIVVGDGSYTPNSQAFCEDIRNICKALTLPVSDELTTIISEPRKEIIVATFIGPESYEHPIYLLCKFFKEELNYDNVIIDGVFVPRDIVCYANSKANQIISYIR